MNNVVLIGRLTREPELRYLPNTGTAITRFGLAVERELSKEKREELESEGRPTADFINIVTWGKLAETSATYLVRGQLVGIEGRIQSRSWDDDNGKKRYITEVVAERVEFLEWREKEKFDIEGFYEIDNKENSFL